MKIHFYSPKHVLPATGELDGWMDGNPTNIRQSSKIATAQCWIYLTYIRLKNAGFETTLTHEISGEGIFVALTGNLPPNFLPPKNIYLVGVVADGMLHCGCHFHILQNAAHARRLPFSTYIPHWPQPSLVPRNRERADRFENLCFYGDPLNLAPELRDPTFAAFLKSSCGLNLQIVDSNRWHDYSEADCVMAIREMSRRMFINKPSTKLYNGWLAGVPVIGGRESAFLADGHPNIDHVSCKSQADVLQAISRLRDDPEYRRNIVTEGSRSARRFSPEIIAGRWMEVLSFIDTTHAPAHLSKTKLLSAPIRWKQRLIVTADRLRGGY